MATTQTCSNCSDPLAADAPRGLCPVCLMKAGFGSLADSTATLPAQPTRPAPDIPPAPADLAPHFPQFEIIELIGQGGMGMVYKARQTNLDRSVALKILSPSHGGAAEFSQRFEREAKALARLNHPNIVSVYDFGRAGPHYFFSMEYVDGQSLADLQRARRLTPIETFSIVAKVCEALEYAHAGGLVHRDIKPANVLIDAKGNAKLGDFGLAKILGQPGGDLRLTLTGVRMGTPKYMAPEQMDGPESVDHRADLYSLGVVFYEMLTGELPVGRFSPPSQALGLSRRLDAIIDKILERDPARRYQRAAEVSADLENMTRSGLNEEPPSRARWRPTRRVAVLAAVAVALGGAGVFGWRSLESVNRARPGAASPAAAGDLATSSVPGWFLEGTNAADFIAGIDRQATVDAKPSLYLKNTKAAGTASLVQAIRPDNYRGKRVRFGGQLRARDVTGRAGLCMHVDYYGMVQCEDRNRNDVQGAAEWRRFAIVLDIPAGSDRISFGVQLTGPGQVWMNDLTFDVVGRDVPTTGSIVADGLPGTPQFDFGR